MRVFVTGATGWVGSAVVDDLIAAGHQVKGLVRDGDKATILATKSAGVVRGTLDDLDIIYEAARTVDAVIHTAFNHDFSKFQESAAQDQRVIEALGSSLEGSDRPLVVTSGLSGIPCGGVETDSPHPAVPRKSEVAAQSLAERGVRVATVRLAPSVHGSGDHGFIPLVIRKARETGVSAFIGEGLNLWSGVHRLDAARLYRLVLESGVTESVYHAVADESVPFKRIAEVIGTHLGLPIVSRTEEHFGWFATMVGANMTVSSERTRELLDWRPTGPDLLSDLKQPSYYTG
ncbi:SDR family oxidoreductase [Vreelandella titanicae]|uniref:SDR family oxidoreductase n=1 Tax=Halomonadaceae TaxID=28256 RepID=UPI0004854BE4|nr:MULTISPECIES: SDR family oxidoreductase [unclassified Halomonas]NAO96226.1 NAD(P)H-binding protein [Halomonas sp. MG34]PKH58664.1 3-beta hydroxysteroid dehydrogenase [Halomonas sp. Choline-3u-9]QGQ69533.1 SDR family oxidoreductase [Halomonas sp. PA16-9]